MGLHPLCHFMKTKTNPIEPEIQVENRFLGIHNDNFYCLSVEKDIYTKADNNMKTYIKCFDMVSFREKTLVNATDNLNLSSIVTISTLKFFL